MADYISSPWSLASIIEGIAVFTTCVGSLVGNGCVVASILRSHRLRERLGIYLVGSLATVDGVFMPIAMAYQLTLINNFAMATKVCHFFSAYFATIIYVSIFHLLFMSLERFVVIVFPLRYETMLTPRRVVFFLLVAWFLPVCSMVVVPFLLGIHEQGANFRASILSCHTISVKTESSSLAASRHQIHLLANNVLMVAIPFLVMLILNGKIAMISYKQAKKTAPAQLTAVQRRNNEMRTKEVKWAKTIGMVIGAFAVTYIPCCICTSVETQLGSGTIPVEVFRFFTVVVFLNSASNAVIYSIRSAEYRREIKRFIKDVTSKICPSIAESQRNTHVRPAFEMINFPSATSRTQANDVIPSGDHHSLVTLNVNRLEVRDLR